MKPRSWDETWMAVAESVAKRSGCCRRQIGAVIVDPYQRIVATGYNGPPAGLKETRVIGGLDAGSGFDPVITVLEEDATCEKHCPRAQNKTASGITIPPTAIRDYSNCISIHAEANALLFCDRRHREGGTIYITSSACWECAKQIANSGLKRVVMKWDKDRDKHREPEKSFELLERSGLEVETWESLLTE